MPSEREYLEAYCQARGVPLPDPVVWAFFLALSLFRAAAILAGVGARARLGNASSAKAGAVRVEEGKRFGLQACGVVTSAVAVSVRRPSRRVWARACQGQRGASGIGSGLDF